MWRLRRAGLGRVPSAVIAALACLATTGCFRCDCGCGPRPPDDASSPPCGNDRIDPGEDCDGADVGGATCTALLPGTGGVLACTPACGLDTSGCADERVCGDGLIADGESCDATNTAGLRCVDLGFAAGLLRCTESCDLDVSACLDEIPPYDNGAHDLDGDSFADLVIAARNGAAGPGAVYVYRGGPPPLDVVPDAEYVGDDSTDFIRVVAFAGDLDGDGAPDLAIGLPYTDRVLVHLGTPGALPDAVPDLVLEGETPGDSFGWAVAGVGDVDGDAFDDLAVGNREPVAEAGRVYFFRGGPGAALDGAVDWTVDGPEPGARFGSTLAGAGDLNLDGLADTLVGSPGYDDSNEDTGLAHVVLGPPATSSPDWTLALPGTWFLGACVTAAGDADGDGSPDFAVGAANWIGTGAGRVWLYTASTSPTGAFEPVEIGIVDGPTTDDGFGSACATAGDVNRDGLNDLLVGAPMGFGCVGGWAPPGNAYLYLGGAFTPAGTSVSVSLDSVVLADYFGSVVAGVGDLDGDGLSDVALAATMSDGAGRVEVYLGRADGLDPSPAAVLVGDAPLAGFGASIATWWR